MRCRHEGWQVVARSIEQCLGSPEQARCTCDFTFSDGYPCQRVHGYAHFARAVHFVPVAQCFKQTLLRTIEFTSLQRQNAPAELQIAQRVQTVHVLTDALALGPQTINRIQVATESGNVSLAIQRESNGPQVAT